MALQEWELARRSLEVRILAYCIVPDHFHLIVRRSIGERVRRFLHRTLAQTSRRLQPGGGFWKERPRALLVYSRAVLRTRVDYIHANPVRRGLVSDPADWEWSSFRESRLATAAAGSDVTTGGRLVYDSPVYRVLHVCNDNPFSESQFKTMKHRPEFPAKFGCLEDARGLCGPFFDWYNTEHHHSGIALLTPENVHYGLADKVSRARLETLQEAYRQHPERFVRKPPEPPRLPEAVWINPPEAQSKTLELLNN